MNQVVIFVELRLHAPGGHIVTRTGQFWCFCRMRIRGVAVVLFLLQSLSGNILHFFLQRCALPNLPTPQPLLTGGCVSSWTLIKTEIEICHVYLPETLIADPEFAKALVE